MRITSPRTPAPAACPAAPATTAATPDPPVAAALFAAWSGDPIVIIDSPPGAGKTRLITHLAHALATRARLRVAIAGQTKIQVADLAGRLAALGQHVSLLGGASHQRPAGLHHDVSYLQGHRGLRATEGVVIATTSRWLWTDNSAYAADILLVDEAYQLIYADLGALGGMAAQVVLVGDPGQISPVVTGDTSRWAGSAAAPHLPAPQALLATFDESTITRQRLTKSWRLGPETTGIIQPAFYPSLPFTSARPPMHLTGPDGHPLPEITTRQVNPTSEEDPLICRIAAARVRDLLHCTLTDAGGTRPMTPSDVAVITPRVHQASLAAALLADLDNVLIGTANAAQGAERAATVVIHPLTGQHETTPFNTDAGRTCVALTRHKAHATVITDPDTPALLTRAISENPADTWLPVHARLWEALHAH